jgi:hypothetical protein
MKSVIALALAALLMTLASSDLRADLLTTHVGASANGTSSGGGCTPTGLDFSNNCNAVYVPALIH